MPMWLGNGSYRRWGLLTPVVEHLVFGMTLRETANGFSFDNNTIIVLASPLLRVGAGGI